MGGHVHPGVKLGGMRLPCFWFGERVAILPAFGKFTGLHVMRPGSQPGERVYAVGPGAVIPVFGVPDASLAEPRSASA